MLAAGDMAGKNRHGQPTRLGLCLTAILSSQLSSSSSQGKSGDVHGHVHGQLTCAFSLSRLFKEAFLRHLQHGKG